MYEHVSCERLSLPNLAFSFRSTFYNVLELFGTSSLANSLKGVRVKHPGKSLENLNLSLKEFFKGVL